MLTARNALYFLKSPFYSCHDALINQYAFDSQDEEDWNSSDAERKAEHEQ